MYYTQLVKNLRAMAVRFDHDRLFGDSKDVAAAANAIEELQRKIQEWQEAACGWNNKYYELLDSQPHWIPVAERLPEKPGIYAVWTARGFGNHLSASNWDGESWSLRVTHWMPLPEPPKEKTE